MYKSSPVAIYLVRVMIFMKRKPWKVYAFWILLAEAVGALSGFLTREGMQYFTDSVQKPALSPPPIAFPIAWGILYALMGIGMARGAAYIAARALGWIGSLISAFLLYFICLFALQRFAKPELKLCRRFLTPVVVTTVIFVILMILFRENMRLNIFISAVYAFTMFFEIWRFSKQNERRLQCDN